MNQPRYLAFDIETVKPFPQGENWRDHRPIGIACAAAYSNDTGPLNWHRTEPDGTIAERLDQQDAQALVQDLLNYVQQGLTIVTWNGLGFDFDVLAEESGRHEDCRRMAHQHVDMMFHIFCHKGYPISLATLAKGMSTPGKTEGMTGDLATQMWARGERQPVIDYCVQDTHATLQLAEAGGRTNRLEWHSQSGRPQALALNRGWLTVHDAALTPEPNTSWMDNPIPRSNFTSWLTAPTSMPTT